MSRLGPRRSLITLVTIVSLFSGAVAIRAAAGWTAGTAPLDQPPDARALVGKLQDEQARADAIASELRQVLDRSAELRDALHAAQEKAAADAETANALTEQLAAAEAKLAELGRQLASAPKAAAAGTTATAPASTGTVEHEGEPGDD
jgi:hypothetical protein